MNQQSPQEQQSDTQAKGQFQRALQPPQKRYTLWRRSRSASRKIRISTGSGLFFILCLLTLSIGIVLDRAITAASTVTRSSGVAIAPHSSSSPAAITVDFSSRQNHAHPLGNSLLGVNGFSHIRNTPQLLNYLSTSHLKMVRISVDMPGTFPTPASVNPQQQNWTVLDASMTVIQAQGLQPIVTIEFAPPWLQPQQNACLGLDPSHVYPTSTSVWGTLAAQVVAHMDTKFPGVHPYYEIWNEPDGITFLCVPASDPNPDQTRITEYKAIYAAAAPLMKQQAQQDHMLIQVGGPALAVPRLHASIWLPALINDPTVAPYIDFISYHNYFRIRHADTWGNKLSLMQDPTAGVAALFENVSAIVHKGKQPNAQSTLIFIDEYNATTSSIDCCRNDKTFAPLWNALFITDLLNSVNDTSSPYGPAHAFPSGLTYFTAAPQSSTSHFCLFGTWNSAMDCAQNGSIQPYPQYYTYQLLGDSHFCDMTNGGYITNAAVGKPAGLVTSGFYTSTKDNVLIVNTSGTAYTQLTIALQNPGLALPTASVYTLNASYPQIGTSSATLSAVSGGYTVTISVPAYSTVALSLI
jgi:hypothetical protein